jgi:hypothetical protein
LYFFDKFARKLETEDFELENKEEKDIPELEVRINRG